MQYTQEKQNPLHHALLGIGILIMIAGFVGGAMLANVPNDPSMFEPSSSDYHFVIAIALPYWAGGFISGFFFVGIAEIIRLLNIMACKYAPEYMHVIPKPTESTAQQSESVQ